MKRLIKGGFLTLSGTIGITGTMMVAMQSPANAWVTPPGRMIISIFENGLKKSAVKSRFLRRNHTITTSPGMV